MAYQFDSAKWMEQSSDWIGDKSLSDICILGSHDAHMSECNGILDGV